MIAVFWDFRSLSDLKRQQYHRTSGFDASKSGLAFSIFEIAY